MKFIHLAPRQAVSRIAANGLRLGNGIRGRGVYAVPLMRFPQFHDKDEHRYTESSEGYICSNMSLIKLWKSILFQSIGSNRGSSFASIVFELSESQWPVRVFLGGWPQESYHEFLSPNLPQDDTEWAVVGKGGWLNCNELEFTAKSPKGLGLLIKRYRDVGKVLAAYQDDYLEVVISSRIPARNIVKIVAHYERSRMGKRRINDENAGTDTTEYHRD